jgi:hypothetical protein
MRFVAFPPTPRKIRSPSSEPRCPASAPSTARLLSRATFSSNIRGRNSSLEAGRARSFPIQASRLRAHAAARSLPETRSAIASARAPTESSTRWTTTRGHRVVQDQSARGLSPATDDRMQQRPPPRGGASRRCTTRVDAGAGVAAEGRRDRAPQFAWHREAAKTGEGRSPETRNPLRGRRRRARNAHPGARPGAATPAPAPGNQARRAPG